MLAQHGGGFRIGHVEGARARTGFEQILVALQAGMDAGVDLGRPASPWAISLIDILRRPEGQGFQPRPEVAL